MSKRFDVQETPLTGLRLIQRQPLRDKRGFLERLFCADELADVFGGRKIVQVNHTLTVQRGTIRGMHFQFPPKAEMKLVSCVRGSVFDVAVDVRQGSPTFLQWHAQLLSADNHRAFLIPEGYAHGFQTLSEDCEMLYFHTAAYDPSAEGGLNPRDPSLAIDWPLEIAEVSARDQSHSLASSGFEGVLL